MKCNCALDCDEQADPLALDPDLCTLCNEDDHCYHRGYLDCACNLGCSEQANPDAPDPTLCDRCNGNDCKAGVVTDKGAPIKDVKDVVISYDGIVNNVEVASDFYQTVERSGLEIRDVFTERLDYLFVFDDVTLDGWSPKALYARLRRKKVTVYMESPEGGWTVQECAEALVVAAEHGLIPRVFVGETSEAPGTVAPTDQGE